jgi:hypothetical protein
VTRQILKRKTREAEMTTTGTVGHELPQTGGVGERKGFDQRFPIRADAAA